MEVCVESGVAGVEDEWMDVEDDEIRKEVGVYRALSTNLQVSTLI